MTDELIHLDADAERELEASVCMESFPDFFRAAWPVHEPATPLVWGWALETVCEHLQAIVEDWARRQRDSEFVQRMRNLLVTEPPGSAKSRMLSYLIPWAWLRWPHLRAIALCCNPRVSLRDSMFARDIIASSWYQRTFAPSWKVRDDADAKGTFMNTAGGFRAAMGFDARIVGERADLIIVDDPHDPEQAESQAQRDKVHDRWDGSISNRVNDLGTSIRVGIAQRTHEDDWSARRIAEGWTHLDLPMLFEPERKCITPLGVADLRTIDGECLNPQRWPESVIAEERAKGERRWWTLYQGRPTPAGGALVKRSWLRFWRHDAAPQVAARPEGCYTGAARVIPSKMDAIVVAGDLAGGALTTNGDFNALVAIGRAGADFFLLDFWVKRAAFPEVQDRVRQLAQRYPRAKKVIEAAASGGSLVASLERQISGLVGRTAKGDKESRLESVLAFFEAGNVYLPDGAPELEKLIASLTAFPNAAHDDDVDAISLALAELAPGGSTSARERFQVLSDARPATPAQVAAAAAEHEQRMAELRTIESMLELGARVLRRIHIEIAGLEMADRVGARDMTPLDRRLLLDRLYDVRGTTIAVLTGRRKPDPGLPSLWREWLGSTEAA